MINWLDIEKIEVDFSNDDNIYHALGADRVSTIHTQKTMEISSLLGIHIMGFIDREGDDINNEKACEISGYDYLGSKMLLCKTDDSFNALPFTEEELEKVYIYLTEGRVVNTSRGNDELGDFFDRYGINPYLPDLKVKPKAIFFEKYPNIVLIKYDFGQVNTDALMKIGEALFAYSDVMINKFVEVGNEVKMCKNEPYYLVNKGDIGRGLYFILIQAIDGENKEPVIQNIDDFINGKIEEKTQLDSGKPFSGAFDKATGGEAEDLSYMDETEELYILEFEVDVKWPDNPSTPRTHYRYCYPLSELGEKEQPYFLYFEDFFEINTFNDIKEEVGLIVHVGNKDVELNVPLDETVVLPFDYQSAEAKKSRRVGEARFTLRRGDFCLRMKHGYFAFKSEYLNLTKHTVDFEEVKYLDPTSNKKEDGYVELGDGTVAGLYMVDPENDYYIFYCSGDDPDSEEDLVGFFVSVRGDEENVYEDESTDSDTGDRMLLRVTYKYVR